MIACEDTRVTRKLIDRYGIATPLTPYHEHNAAEARPKLLARLAAGQAVALVSDAGTPLISDPGYKLVRAACEAGHRGHRAARRVRGAGGAWRRRPADRPVLLRGLPAAEAGGDGKSASPSSPPFRRRWCCSRADRGSAAALADLADGLGPRAAAICRELTKLHEEVRRGDLAELARDYADGARDARRDRHRGGAAGRRRDADADDVDELLRRALARVSVKDAVGEVALATGRPRREVYQRALALAKDGGDGPA